MPLRRIAITLAAIIFAAQPIAHGDFVPKIAVAYDIGFLGDNGYNDAVHRAFKEAAKRYNLVEPFIREVPTTGTTVDRLSRLTFLAKNGYNLIIAVGPGYREMTLKVAAEYPDTQFALINDRAIAPLNISNIAFDEKQSAYLAGVIAAVRSDRNRIAMIGNNRELFDLFTKGARKIAPKIKVGLIDYSGDPFALDVKLGKTDVVYSLWDKDSSAYSEILSRKTKTWYIARRPDQYFVSNGIKDDRVIAVFAKDLKRPIAQLTSLAVQDRALIDIVDENGSFGREYSIANGGIALQLADSFTSVERAKIQSEIRALKKVTNRG